MPYAAGYLVVQPGDDLSSIPENSINVFFCEEEIPSNPHFRERSSLMFSQFISNMEEAVKKNPCLRTIYCHNFSRFDGIILLRFFTEQGERTQYSYEESSDLRA